MNYRVPLLVLTSLAMAGPLKADLSTTIAQVKPSVLILGSYKDTNSPRFTLRGTGFVIHDGSHEKSNLAVTNAHVLAPTWDGDNMGNWVLQINIAPNEWQMRPCTILALDPEHDLALLRFEGPAVSGLRVLDSSRVREGQSIAFMGFPLGGALGFSHVTHRGTISSITAAALPTPTAHLLNSRTIRSLRSGSFEVFQLDATAYPGNSGGPLLDPETGDVLGVLNMVFIKGTHESALSNPSGISYAIPSTHILDLLQRATK